ncbi:FUSC family protein [Paenibacillus aestuarii]|uniref:Aromatic acid exporter family protein n=1 Tax=Paenibacillus aestuarii TaxID=516965 RepID=A0ABW0K9R9_9BACL|nr:FUSC family protein [Paenibacillus aestuarii]
MQKKMTDLIKNHGVVWKIPVASVLSWEFAELAGSKHPYLAPLTVILSMQLSIDKSIQFAWQRVLGTIAGVLFTVLITPFIPTDGWSIGLLLLVGALIVSSFKLDHAILVQVELSILLVMYFQSKMPTYPLDRIRDTIIGAAIAMAIHILLFPPDSVNKAKRKMVQFSDHLVDHLTNTSLWVQDGCPANKVQSLQSNMQSLFQELHQTTTELDKAEQSLRMNPLGTRKRATMNQLTQHMQQLRSGYANLADMIQVLSKWSENGNFTKENQQLWADHISGLAMLVKQWTQGWNEPGAYRETSMEPAHQIKTPAHLMNDQYPLSLYTKAEQMVQDFSL